jgi:hypothetical protein
VIRSLMKRGVWGGSSDTLLRGLRSALRANPSDVFPVDAIEQAMIVAGKSLRFEPEEVEDLAETSYGSRAFAILSLLYAGSNVQQTTYHVDHIFPRSRFTKPRLVKAGVSEADVDEFSEWSNLLPNLQLLPGAANTQKQAMLPLEWWSSAEPDEQARDALFAAHHMHDLPANMTEFADFYLARRNRMVQRLRDVLGVQPTAEQAQPPTTEPGASGAGIQSSVDVSLPGP